MAETEPRILLERDGLVAVDKPPGLASTGRSLDDLNCLQGALIALRRRMVWAVHQLDTDTSGAILFVTQKRLVAQVARRMRPPLGAKVYLAVCHGEPEFEECWIDEPIGTLGASRSELGVVASGRPARSRVRVLDRARGFSLMEVELITGRTHQARIHLAHVGHPLVGERRYCHPACERHWRQALHSARVSLAAEPSSGHQRLDVEAPLAADLVRLVSELGLRLPLPSPLTRPARND